MRKNSRTSFMPNSHQIKLLITFSALLPVAAVLASPTTGAYFEISQGHEILLKCTIKNLTNYPLWIDANGLPWTSRWNILITATTLNEDAETLKSPPIISDPHKEGLYLEKYESVSGYINLSDRFPSLNKELQSRSVSICYQFSTKYLIRDQKNEVSQGCIILNKKDIEVRD